MTEQKLKDRCTPEFIEWCVNLAEGFEFICGSIDTVDFLYTDIMGIITTNDFPLLLHRAVEGWNDKKGPDSFDTITYDIEMVNILINKYPMPDFKAWRFKDYKPETLTAGECAILDCLLKLFEEKNND